MQPSSHDGKAASLDFSDPTTGRSYTVGIYDTKHTNPAPTCPPNAAEVPVTTPLGREVCYVRGFPAAELRFADGAIYYTITTSDSTAPRGTGDSAVRSWLLQVADGLR